MLRVWLQNRLRALGASGVHQFTAVHVVLSEAVHCKQELRAAAMCVDRPVIVGLLAVAAAAASEAILSALPWTAVVSISTPYVCSLLTAPMDMSCGMHASCLFWCVCEWHANQLAQSISVNLFTLPTGPVSYYC